MDGFPRVQMLLWDGHEVVNTDDLPVSVASFSYPTGTQVCSFALGIVLIAAAFLKSSTPAELATLQTVFDFPQWLAVSAIQAELFVAVLLIAGVWNSWTWWLTVGMFVVFAFVSLHRGLAGYESCGCFGPIEVNPWWTFTFDLAAIGFLLSQRAHFLRQRRHACRSPRMLIAIGVFLALSIPSIALALRAGPTQFGDVAHTIESTTLVVLKPEDWVGTEFPLGSYLNPDVDVSCGAWTILLYHDACPTCQSALPSYNALAADSANVSEPTHVLLVEVPPYGSWPLDRTTRVQHTRLSERWEWFVQTPVEIQLRDGMVKTVSRELPSIANIP